MQDSMLKVEGAINGLCNSSPGRVFEIKAELFKSRGQDLCAGLDDLLKDFWESEGIPADWRHALLVSITNAGENEMSKLTGISVNKVQQQRCILPF